MTPENEESRPQQEGGPIESDTSANKKTATTGLSMPEYAWGKRLLPNFLGLIGVSTQNHLGQDAVRISYKHEDGTEAAVRFRLALEASKDPYSKRDRRFVWRKGSTTMLYGLETLGGFISSMGVRFPGARNVGHGMRQTL